MFTPRPSHTPFYCEENLWHLCQDPLLPSGDRQIVVIEGRVRILRMGVGVRRHVRLPAVTSKQGVGLTKQVVRAFQIVVPRWREPFVHSATLRSASNALSS